MSTELREGIELAYGERSDFLVIALTGRTGSGCTTTADLLCKTFQEIQVANSGDQDIENRKLSIVEDFARVTWQPFRKITVSTVILSYLIECEWKDTEEFLRGLKAPQSSIDKTRQSIEALKQDADYAHFRDVISQGAKSYRDKAWDFYSKTLGPAATRVKEALGKSYVPAFQQIGDNIRFSGNALSSQIKKDELFSLIRRVKRLAKAAFYTQRMRNEGSTRIVIDAVRNPLELVYLRDQFAAFYAVAITADDSQRKARLTANNVSARDIEALDQKEYSKKPLDSYAHFVSQNLKDCIQKSDIFFANPGTPETFEENSKQLKSQILRYVSLMVRPGLVTPTRNERCMQLAFVAKLNSGCISRQVGAAVTDKDHSIKAVGWNDVPKGQIPCLLRDAGHLLGPGDKDAFSDYEKNDRKFRDHLGKKLDGREALKTGSGLRCPFCFKDAYNEVSDKDGNNQVHTRSLHAEENAFLQLAKQGNSGIAGGVLYTTASPCELCSKKAFQLGITEIIYVDPYPGISSTHVLASGVGRPKLHLFSGAIGHAYHRLYEPMMPIKDEFMARLKADPQPHLL